MWLIVALIWVLALLVGTTAAVSERQEEHETTTDVHFAEPRIDLYGNEIDEAVGDYRVDGRGDLYERHAPDTAVLNLAPPGV